MTNDKDPIDPTSTEGQNIDKPAKPSDENPSRFQRIRERLSPSSSTATEEIEDEETAEQIDKERRAAMYKVGAGAGAIGLGVGAVAGSQYADRVADEPAPAAIGENNEDPEAVDVDDRMDAYMSVSEHGEIPGPVEGEGYRVEESLLREFDQTAWEDMAAESEYQDLGTGTEFYLQEDGTVVGVNERQQISRTFSSDEFEYNQGFTDLYDDLEEMGE